MDGWSDGGHFSRSLALLRSLFFPCFLVDVEWSISLTLSLLPVDPSAMSVSPSVCATVGWMNEPGRAGRQVTRVGVQVSPRETGVEGLFLSFLFP